jgi:maleylpyruvate isomerase
MSSILYNYFRSSAAYRVRIALNLKNLAYDAVPVHLVKGEHKADNYAALNPQKLVPSLTIDGVTLTQSLAIIEYLDETQTGLKLMPVDALGRAKVRAMADTIAMDIHPLNNVRVLKAITALGATEAQKSAWIAEWIHAGFAALEQQVAGDFCYGDTPGLADCCLVPQVFSARRFNVDLAAYPKLVAIDARCNAFAAFVAAQPKNQADFEA